MTIYIYISLEIGLMDTGIHLLVSVIIAAIIIVSSITIVTLIILATILIVVDISILAILEYVLPLLLIGLFFQFQLVFHNQFSAL